MSRRRKQDDGLLGDLLDLIYKGASLLPWWVSLLLGVIIYFSLHYYVSLHTIPSLRGWNVALVYTAFFGQYVVPVIFVIAALKSFLNSLRGKELLIGVESQGVTEALAKMSWQDFEILMGQWFKTQGYEVVQAGGAHADGGVDIELRKAGELYLVQCKHYRAWKVPVDTVRDLYGVMTSRGATGGFVVTSGRFTGPATEFASGRVISLIDGEKLAQILKQSSVVTPHPIDDALSVTPKCPKCGSEMIRRTAHHGDNSGKDFWGCSRYPACRGTLSVV